MRVCNSIMKILHVTSPIWQHCHQAESNTHTHITQTNVGEKKGKRKSEVQFYTPTNILTCHQLLLTVPPTVYLSHLVSKCCFLTIGTNWFFKYWKIIITKLFAGLTNKTSRPSMLAEAETTLLLIKRDHTSTFGCVNGLYHGNYLIHFGPFIGIGIPTSFHHVCQRTWATSWYFWSQILPNNSGSNLWET